MKTKIVQLSALYIAALAVGCTTEYNPSNGLHSFEVALSPAHTQATGTPTSPLDYISGTSCAGTGTCPGTEECVAYCAVSGESCDPADDQCGVDDYCRGVCAKPVHLDIAGVRRDGSPYTPKDKDGNPLKRWVHIQVVPGMVPPPYEYVEISAGEAKNVKLYMAQAVGTSYIWVEDIGMGPSDETYGECNNNKDDDGDGWIDMADPNCLSPNDPVERKATYATGLSKPFHFQNPRIWHIQYTDEVANSPLEDQNIRVDEGQMVVTNVVANGFFVSDMQMPDGTMSEGVIPPYSSFFLYTFNKPEGIKYGDILCDFSGGVVEYQGNTQMTFPTYEVANKSEEDDEGKKVAPCPERTVDITLEVPEPVDVTPLLIEEDPKSSTLTDDVMANARAIEPYESGLIKITGAELSNRFLACDSDENDAYPNGSDDDDCRDMCQVDPYCTQLESFFKYSQISAWADAGKKFYVGLDMLKDNVPLEVPYIGAADMSGNCPDVVDPDTGEVVLENPHTVLIGDTLFIEYLCPTRQMNSITGNLRHIYLCSQKPGRKERCGLQMTMLLPRFDEDFDFVN